MKEAYLKEAEQGERLRAPIGVVDHQKCGDLGVPAGVPKAEEEAADQRERDAGILRHCSSQ